MLGTNSSMGHLCPLALYSANLSSSSNEWPNESVKAINNADDNIRLISFCKRSELGDLFDGFFLQEL